MGTLGSLEQVNITDKKLIVKGHFARWYDAHPRLAFAINLLQLAPLSFQQKVFTTIGDYLELQWSLDHRTSTPETQELKKRWYDFSDETSSVVALIKDSPPTVREATAERLIEILSTAA